MRVLWAAMVYQRDLKHVAPYVKSILNGTLVPSDILIIDAGSDKDIEATVASFGDDRLHYFSLGNTDTNEGFNPSFNFAVRYAIQNGYRSLATMTVRAIPDGDWLRHSVNALSSHPSVGMVTTLNLSESAHEIHSLGHFLSPSGGLYDFGRGLNLNLRDRLINSLRSNDFEAIWAPCCGSALYSVEALSVASKSISTRYEVFHPAGFKSYNCSHLGYLMKASGFTNVIEPNATCIRNDSESTSRNPNSCALLINQELNRIASVYTFWPGHMAQEALDRYMSETRKNALLTALDRRIILTLAKNLTRSWEYQETIRLCLEKHIKRFQDSIDQIHGRFLDI